MSTVKNRIRGALLKSRHSLLLATITAYIVLVVLEGQVMDRQPRIFTFENPYFDLKIKELPTN